MDANESRHRVKQLREIDERLEKIGKRLSRSTALIAQDAENDIRILRNDPRGRRGEVADALPNL